MSHGPTKPTLIARVAELEQDRTALARAHVAAETRLAEVESLLTQANDRINALLADREHIERQLNDLTRQRDTASNTAAQRQLTIDDLNSRLHHALSAVHDLARTADPHPRSPTT